MGQSLLPFEQHLLRLIALNRQRHRTRYEGDRFAVLLGPAARLAVIDCKSSENPSIRRPDRRRPAGAEPMRQGQIAVVGPKRIVGNVYDEYRLAAEGCRAARPDGRPD